MLSKEDNDLLTQVSNGAPMGQMIKQYWWIPAALSEKLEADGAPQRVRLFGDNYVAFRATNGSVGFFDEACPHRGASMALARNEDNSLRCIYHGWRFSVEGVTVEVPTQPQNEAEYCKHVPLKHFPVKEEAGIVWVWLGLGDTPPPFPELPFVGLPAGHTTAFRQKVNANWLQGVETTMDSAHLGVLHQTYTRTMGAIGLTAVNQAPVYHLVPQTYGFRYAAVRDLPDGRKYVRTNSFVAPWYGVIAAGEPSVPRGALFFSVPVDDENIWYWNITYNTDSPVLRSPAIMPSDGDSFPPLPPGDENNNWGQDRQLMKLGHFTGFPQALGTEDFAVIMSQGPIVDRSKEYLGAGDGALVQVRRTLMAAVREFVDGKVPALTKHADIDYSSAAPVSVMVERDAEWRSVL